MSRILVSVVILIDKDNKILVEKRYCLNFKQTFWQFPGGKIEDKESLHEAAIREVKEELNITIKKNDLIPFLFEEYFKNKDHFIIFYYICKTWKGTVVAHENQSISWLKVSEINIKDMLPYNGYVFNKLINFLAK